MGNKKRIALRVLISSFVLIALLAGPSGYFYYTYMTPKTDLPPISLESSEVWLAPDIGPTLAADLLKEVAAAQANVHAPSFSAAIAFDGALQWAGAVGYETIETGEVASITSQYRLGSTSKAMTGALLGHLVEEGTINLDQAIGTYASDLPESHLELTPRQLASHTAGVRHYSRVPTYWPGWHPGFSATVYPTVKDGLSIFIDDPLEYTPGSGFAYSTYGYSLLAYVLEEATGQDLKTLVQERLFDPISMTNAAFDFPGDAPELVSFYTSGDEKYSAAYSSGATYKLAGGGMVASASDVARFGLALLESNYLDAETKEIIFTPVKLADGSDNPQNYALGFRIDTSLRLLGEDRPVLLVHHGGSQNGGGSFFMILPEYGISVSALTNTGDRAARIEAQDLAYRLVRTVIEAKN